MNERRFERGKTKILIEYGTLIETDVDAFVEMLDRMVATGSRFKDEQTFELGWSVMRFVEAGNGMLAFEELDGSGTPDTWTRGVTRALTALRLQTNVNESLGLANEVDFPRLDQTAVTCTKIAPNLRAALVRLAPTTSGDSGWFFGCQQGDSHDHDEPRNLRNETLYASACRLPAALGYLAMPVGTTVLLAADGSFEEAAVSGKRLTPQPGSYLAEVAKRDKR